MKIFPGYYDIEKDLETRGLGIYQHDQIAHRIMSLCFPTILPWMGEWQYGTPPRMPYPKHLSRGKKPDGCSRPHGRTDIWTVFELENRCTVNNKPVGQLDAYRLGEVSSKIYQFNKALKPHGQRISECLFACHTLCDRAFDNLAQFEKRIEVRARVFAIESVSSVKGTVVIKEVY